MLKKIMNPTIAQIVSYYPPHLGGMENCAAQIAEGLVKRDYIVNVYTSNQGYIDSIEPHYKAHVKYLSSIEFAHTPIIVSLFPALLKLPKNSIMHLHISQAYSPEMVYLVSKIRKIPYIAHIHLDVDASGPFGILLGIYKKIFLKKVLHNAAKIICLSKAQKNLICEKYAISPDKVVIIPNGVEAKYFIKKSEDPHKSAPHILFVGRLAVQKNISMLIDAINKMNQSAIIDIVGEGEERSSIENMINKYKMTNVILHGKKIGSELLDLYRNADLFVLPSLKEGVSLAMLEAMAAGLPIVASYSPEMKELIDTCGVVIENPSAETYAKILDQLVANKEMISNLGNAASKKAQQYSWETVLDNIETVYKGVANAI